MLKSYAGGGFADMLLPDPPYNVDVTGGTDKKLKIDNDSFNDESEFLGFLTRAFKASSSAMKDGAAAYIWISSMHLPTFSSAMVDSGITWRQVLVWVKNTFSLGRQDYQWRHELCLYGWKPGAPHYFTNSRSESTVYEYSGKEPDKMAKGELLELVKSMSEGRNATDVLRFDKPSANEDHPTMKPVRLFAYLIRNSSKKGQTILDPFGGSGTSVIAAEQMGRRCFCMEIDPHYCDVIIERWERMTGLTAVKEGQAS